MGALHTPSRKASVQLVVRRDKMASSEPDTDAYIGIAVALAAKKRKNGLSGEN